ncbi:tetratricopeptide repeat protein [Streptomyces sp. NPDC046977]|uniref:tetratricopeptide repeat protein n=1 Tax=Streptomyces sp. NPDC046977 TaxID=3154703 RepID=UPI00340ADCDB
MDANDLERRHRTYDGWIPPTVAALLHEYGHHDILRDAADRGDWFCARQLAATAEQGPVGRAVARALLEPFAATGWWPAVSAVVALLADGERSDEALSLLRAKVDSGHREAVRVLARLLAGLGRIDELVALLGPRSADQGLAGDLVELTAGHGRDAEIAALLPPVRTGSAAPFEDWNSDTWDTVPLHAVLLERQGQIDKAAALLDSAGHARHLVHLFARHNREAELRALTAGADKEYAMDALAGLLEERDRVPEAVALLKEPAQAGDPHAAFALADLLARQGRHDEAVEVLRPVVEASSADSEWIVRLLCRSLVDAGRADEALACIDDHFARHSGPRLDHALARSYVLELCGRAADAEAERAPFAPTDEELLQDGTVSGAITLAERLVRRSEPRKAIAHLRDRLDQPRALQREHLRQPASYG